MDLHAVVSMHMQFREDMQKHDCANHFVNNLLLQMYYNMDEHSQIVYSQSVYW